EVQASYGIAGLRFFGFFFQADCMVVFVKCDDTITFGVDNRVGKYGCPLLTIVGTLYQRAEIVAMEDIVTKNKRTRMAVDKRLTNNERLGQAIGLSLDGVVQRNTPLAAVAHQLL